MQHMLRARDCDASGPPWIEVLYARAGISKSNVVDNTALRVGRARSKLSCQQKIK